MTGTILADEGARRRAVTDFSSNLVIVAGAGTGKTSLLVERALSALARGVAGIHEIAAITFTEKAAGEMRERLGTGLSGYEPCPRGSSRRTKKRRRTAPTARSSRRRKFPGRTWRRAPWPPSRGWNGLG